MDPEAVRSFARRDRSEIDALKRDHWARRFRDSAESTWRAGQMLREHARCVRPDWPTERERADDLAHHVRLKRLFDRAADAFASR